MRKTSKYALLVAATLLLPVTARADLGPLEPLADLHRAVRETLGLPEPLIVQLLEDGLPHEQLPVVGLLSRELRQAPEEIVRLHRSGLSYLDVALRFGSGPELFHVALPRDPGPPYGNAWGYYKKTPRAQWRTIRLTDVDVVNLVNLRLCRDHYRIAPDRVARLRREGRDFSDIHRELARETGKHGRRGPAVDKPRGGNRSKPGKPGGDDKPRGPKKPKKGKPGDRDRS